MEAFVALNSMFELEFFHSDSYFGNSSNSAPPTSQHHPLTSDYLPVPVAPDSMVHCAQASKLSRNIKGEEDRPNMVFHGCILLHQSMMVAFIL